jgi:serine/threonine protein kinase
MANVVSIKATDGSEIKFINEIRGAGAMKDVYFSPCGTYVVAFFRDKQDYNARERLENIVGTYRERIFDQPGGDYWRGLFCWPTKIVEHEGKVGVVAPTYRKNFFFEFGSSKNDFLKIKGKEKEGKWFASANHQSRHLDERERGNWRSYLATCIKISRTVKRMHAAGLAHSDLSYKNVLVDPSTGDACIIDIDGLVVPGKYPPDVVGTPDFIAPEVMATMKLSRDDPKRALPKRETDQHALSVLIYMYLLYRHPLRGRKIHHSDPMIDEELGMGEKALFVEHPTDLQNRPNPDDVGPGYLPWADVDKRPFTVTGPYLTALFKKAFIDGLHAPSKRPSADEWERALVKTTDLMQPCANPACEQKWYVLDNTTAPCCPFCGTKFVGELPVLNLYSSRGKGKFTPDNHRLMVYSDQYLYQWHVNRLVFPNERLANEHRTPVGYFKLAAGSS